MTMKRLVPLMLAAVFAPAAIHAQESSPRFTCALEDSWA